ncbi:MAG: permease-like cell division protein FtsX [Ancrocorticia sp.]|uniref:permease-like cell division protein FtsX n=1 Tax=Ancrocorticia sp. TaxID=2593684 RepID=UPI003F932C7E
MRLRFILSQTFRGLWANKAMAASVALVTFVSLLFVGAASLLQTQVSNLKGDWYDKVEVSVFMCPINSTAPQCAAGEATDEQIADIEEFLETDEISQYIDTVHFETKAEALEDFKDQMDGTAWVDSLSEDQMEASFRIKLSDPEEYQVVAESLDGRPGVLEAKDQRAQLEPLFDMLNRFTVIAGVLAGVMIITALLLMPTTIRLSAMSRRDETEIMRYVGASNAFIELPFILEGIIASLTGSLLAVGGLWVTVKYFISDWLGNSMAWMQIIGTGDVWKLSPFLILGAIVVAGIASWVTLRRYAKV